MEQTSDSGILIAAIIITVLLLPISTTFVRRFSVDQRSLTNLFHILSSFSLGTGLKWRAAGRTIQHPQQVLDRRVFHTSRCWEPASVLFLHRPSSFPQPYSPIHLIREFHFHSM